MLSKEIVPSGLIVKPAEAESIATVTVEDVGITAFNKSLLKILAVVSPAYNEVV